MQDGCRILESGKSGKMAKIYQHHKFPHAWETQAWGKGQGESYTLFRTLPMKLSKHLCLECSTCAMFFSLSFTVSIMALFLSKSLSETLINAPFMLLFNLVITPIRFKKRSFMSFLNRIGVTRKSSKGIVVSPFLTASCTPPSTCPY